MRPLTAIEEISWTFNTIDAFNALIVAHVIGDSTLEAWRSALDAVQRRHALLGVSIDAPDGDAVGQAQPLFRSRPGLRIPLRTLAWADVPRWEAEVERELGHAFEPGECPLIRATLIHGPSRSILILAATHAITDGISLSLIVRDLLTAVSGGKLVSLAFPASTEELLGMTPARHGPIPAERLAGSRVNRRAGTPVVSTLQIAEAATRDLVDACRRQGCSLHGALVAAAVQAMRRQAAAFASKPVRTISPINVRNAVEAGDANGMYIVLHGITFGPGDGTLFWETARHVRSELAAAARPDAVAAAMAAMRHLVAQGMTSHEAQLALDGPFGLDVLVTNLGRIPYPARFGNLTLDRLFPAVMNTQSSAQAIAIATVGDNLCLLNTSREPMAGLLEALSAILTEQCV